MVDVMEVRLQLAAVTLAEELNFTRAAERLKITQPALSKQIVELENRLGFSVLGDLSLALIRMAIGTSMSPAA
jgi:hypothetical protein